jgi:prevent-host-death family protein
MDRVRPSADIQPLSAFRANAARLIEQVKTSGRPMILTQHGKSAAVVLDVHTYEALIDELQLVRDIGEAAAQLDRGEGVDHQQAVTRLQGQLGR